MRQPIVFILDRFDDANAGTESQIVLLLHNLDRARFSPRVALLRGPDGISRYLDGVPVEVLNVDQIRSVRSWMRAWRFARSARRVGIRIAHIFFNDASIILPLPLRLAGFRVVISRRDLGFWYTPPLLRLLRFVGRFVDAAVCNAEAVREVVIAKERLPRERTTVIYNGVAREQTMVARDEARRHLGLPEDAFLVVTVANLRPLKRIDTIIRAFARLRHKTPEIHLIVAGADRAGTTTPSHQSELKHLAHTIGVAERVHFVGAIDNPMGLLNGADIAVLASETEGLSNSIIEYLIAGKAVLCTPVGGSRELVSEGETGFFFDVGDDVALAQRICKLQSDPALLMEMGQRAARSAHARFHTRVLSQSHERLYEHLLANERSEACPLPTMDCSTEAAQERA